MGGHPKYRVKKGRAIHRKVSIPSSISKNYCTDLLLLTSRKNLLGRRRNLTLVSSEKFQSLGENRTDHPPSSSADALTTVLLEVLEAIWREGSKINYYYTVVQDL